MKNETQTICPYCAATCEPTNDIKNVNGIKPTDTDGCEFCNPLPFDE